MDACTTSKVYVTIEASGAKSLEVHDHPRLIGGCAIHLQGVSIVLDPDATAQLLGVLIGRHVPLGFDTGGRQQPRSLGTNVAPFPSRGGDAA